MGRKALDLTGVVSGKITVVGRVEGKDKQNSYWLCRCQCDENTIKELIVSGINIKTGNTTSCGCKTLTLDGLSKTQKVEYVAWQQIHQRCYNLKNRAYQKYGGRGIMVCERWHGSGGFLAFFEDMGPCPKGCSLDRIDNDGIYKPGNCRWAGIEEQNNNRGDYNVKITLNGETKSGSQWAKEYGLDPSLVLKRLKLGWDPIRALTTRPGPRTLKK